MTYMHIFLNSRVCDYNGVHKCSVFFFCQAHSVFKWKTSAPLGSSPSFSLRLKYICLCAERLEIVRQKHSSVTGHRAASQEAANQQNKWLKDGVDT